MKIYQELKKCDKEDSFGKQHQINNMANSKDIGLSEKSVRGKPLKSPIFDMDVGRYFSLQYVVLCQHSIG